MMRQRFGEKLLTSPFGHGPKDTADSLISAEIALRIPPRNG
jgi:hypothetical protein